jgi:GTP-binding protein
MRFVDEVTLRVQAGAGGRGCVSFRREKYVPRGGPDGGDGGRGGDVYLETSERKHTLLDFHYRHRFEASSGAHGRGKNQHGRAGDDLILLVPVGTLVKDPASGQVLADLVNPGERWLAAKGGRGGLGNARFVSATRQVPRFAEDGQAGEEREFLVELKLLADVALVGLPNAGKSTLIAAVTAARPKIADYPFTTLVPHLGVVTHGDSPPFVMADVPGLIEGAHKGSGLGIRFLRHIERTRLIVHVVDVSLVSLDDPLQPYRQIEAELSCYRLELMAKPRIIVLNKIDRVADVEKLAAIASAYRRDGLPVVPISALQRRGLQELLGVIVASLERTARQQPSPEPSSPSAA